MRPQIQWTHQGITPFALNIQFVWMFWWFSEYPHWSLTYGLRAIPVGKSRWGANMENKKQYCMLGHRAQCYHEKLQGF